MPLACHSAPRNLNGSLCSFVIRIWNLLIIQNEKWRLIFVFRWTGTNLHWSSSIFLRKDEKEKKTTRRRCVKRMKKKTMQKSVFILSSSNSSASCFFLFWFCQSNNQSELTEEHFIISSKRITTIKVDDLGQSRLISFPLTIDYFARLSHLRWSQANVDDLSGALSFFFSTRHLFPNKFTYVLTNGTTNEHAE